MFCVMAVLLRKASRQQLLRCRNDRASDANKNDRVRFGLIKQERTRIKSV